MPDAVHVLIDGRIVATGGPELAREVEARGLRRVPHPRGGVMAPRRRARSSATSRSSNARCNGKRIVYLDSASSSQKPLAVLDAMDDCYRHYYANVHRGVYTIAEESTAAMEAARAKVARFVNARQAAEIVFVRNATEAINLVAYSWARANLQSGDAIVLSHMEHHANVVPWQMLAAERGVELRWIPLTPDYRLDLDESRRAARRRAAARDQRDVERARHDQPRHRPLRRGRARRRRARTRRRVPVRAARRHRRAGLGRRLRRVLVAQDVRPERHRRVVGPRTSCSKPCRRSSAAAR